MQLIFSSTQLLSLFILLNAQKMVAEFIKRIINSICFECKLKKKFHFPLQHTKIVKRGREMFMNTVRLGPKLLSFLCELNLSINFRGWDLSCSVHFKGEKKFF